MNLKSLKIVVAEDDSVICWHLKRQLEYLSAVGVRFFESQEEVLLHVGINKTDLLITNLQLLNGWVDEDYLHSLKSCEYHVIILTGLCDQRLQPRIDLDLPLTFLYKPFTPLQLKNCLLKVVELSDS